LALSAQVCCDKELIFARSSCSNIDESLVVNATIYARGHLVVEKYSFKALPSLIDGEHRALAHYDTAIADRHGWARSCGERLVNRSDL
jgi:hypothetical protein